MNSTLLARILSLLSLPFFAASLQAAEWSWTWQPAPGDKAPGAEVCAFKYAKRWAYAVEIDDGPKWVRSFAAPFLAQYHYTDAPPGVHGGVRRPFVGSVAVIVGVIGNNDATVNWEDLGALLDAGWGVMNHSFDHRANDWSGDSAKLSDAQAREDAFWSQTLLAANLPGGRAPTGAVYANGYTDYNRCDALADCGIRIATRVGGASPRDVLSPQVKWMDFPRSYLDENVWVNEWNKARPMADFPGDDPEGPVANSLVIDFTHGIDREPGSPNQARWRARLKTIESRWGAEGADALWCAPTAEVADYVRAARAAKVTAAPGRLTVFLPDEVPGSALTLRLSGIGPKALIEAPEGGALYRQGDAVALTTPRIGPCGAPPPAPRLRCIYAGPAVSVDFPKPVAVAGVTLRVFGNLAAALPYRLAVRGAKGDAVFAERTVGPGWVVGGLLCPILPASPAILGTGIAVTVPEPVKGMAVWALDTDRP
ncbi:MAG: polysaccharide deacetylase family protein [Limisphaerales bacterium]